MSNEELEKRVESLEGEVRELRAQVRRINGRNDELQRRASSRSGASNPTSSTRSSARDSRRTPRNADSFDLSAESLIAKIGIALVLLGVVFLLKYSYDQGWLTETIRVALGFATGAALLAVGTHQRDSNPSLASILMGGAIASFYGSVFASNALYEMIPWVVAMAAMIGTTMLGFVLAVRQDQPILSVIATIGGFATPFVLDGAEDASMLEIYTLVMLMGTTAIYLLRGWRSLLLTTALGALAVLVPAAVTASEEGAFKLVMVVLVIFATTVATSLIPAVRAAIYRAGDMYWLERMVAIVTPMAAIALFEVLADGNTMLVVVGTGVLSATYFAFHSVSGAKTQTYISVGAALAVATVFILLGVEPLATALAGLGVVSNLLAREVPDFMRLLGYAALAALGTWTFALLLTGSDGMVLLNPDGLQMVLATAALVGVALSYEEEVPQWVHYYVATFAGMATVAHQFSEIGDGVPTAIWGIFAIGVLVVGFLVENGKVQSLGVVVIILTAGKLLIFDLETVATIWRVALFMAFGGAMLAISFWRGLSKSDEIETDSQSPTT